MQRNEDGTIKMDENARARLLVKTPGQALVYRRRVAKQEQIKREIKRQQGAWYDPDEPSIGQAKKLTADLLGLRPDQGLMHTLNKKDGLTRTVGVMEARSHVKAKKFVLPSK